jgi:hypothetical protein
MHFYLSLAVYDITKDRSVKVPELLKYEYTKELVLKSENCLNILFIYT